MGVSAGHKYYISSLPKFHITIDDVELPQCQSAGRKGTGWELRPLFCYIERMQV